MSATSDPGRVRYRKQTLAQNRAYQDGYDDGFDRGTQAGVAYDRLRWCAIGIIFGALVTFLARALT